MIFDVAEVEQAISFEVVIKQVVHLPPREVAGNHTHPRIEAFFSFDRDVVLIWADKKGNIYSNDFVDKDGIVHLFIVNPNVPHAIKNNTEHTATLIEFANAHQQDVIQNKLA
jgi:hypothetical protein